MSLRRNKYPAAVCAFIILSSFIVSVNAYSFPFSGKVPGTDSSVFLYVANIILDGGMPYLDTFDHKGPVIYLIDAFGLLIGSRYGIWIMELITIGAISTFTYKTARLMDCGRLAACAAVGMNALVLILYLDGGNFTEEYACAFLTVSLYLFLKYFKTGNASGWQLLLCGASFAAVCLLRINMIVLWGVMCIGVVIDCVRRKALKDIPRFILWFLLGAAAVAAPIIIWFWSRGALVHFIDASLLFNFRYSSDPVRSSLDNKITAALYFFAGNPSLIAVPPLVYFCFSRRRLVDWLCLITFILSVVAVSLSGLSYRHYGMILCPLVAFSVARSLHEVESFLSHKDLRQKLGVISALLCLMMFFGTGVTTAYSLHRMSPTPDPTDLEYRVAQVVIENTDEGDTISVCGTHDSIYLLSGRYSASKYSYQYPIAQIDPQIKDAFLSDLRRLEAQLIVVDPDHFPLEDIMAILETNYEPIATVEHIVVFRKCS